MSKKNNHAKTVIAAAIAAAISASSVFAYDIPYILDEDTNQEGFSPESSLNLRVLTSDFIATYFLNTQSVVAFDIGTGSLSSINITTNNLSVDENILASGDISTIGNISASGNVTAEDMKTTTINAKNATFGGLTNSIIPIQGKAEFLILEPIDNGDGTTTQQDIIIRGGGSVETKSSGGVMIDEIGNVNISSVVVQEETKTSDTAHVVVRDANGLTVDERLAYGHYDENTGLFTENDINIVTLDPVDLGGGNLEVGGYAAINGDVYAAADVYVDGEVNAYSDVNVDGDVNAHANVFVDGKVEATTIRTQDAKFGGMFGIEDIDGEEVALELAPIDNGDGTTTYQKIIVKGKGSVGKESVGGVVIDEIGNVSISKVITQESTIMWDTAHVVVKDANGVIISDDVESGHYDENTGVFTKDDLKLVTSAPVDLGGGNLEVGGDIVIEGSMAVSKDIYADGDAVIEGNMLVSKDIIANADIVANGKIFATDDVLVSGLLSGLGDVSVGKNLLVTKDVSAQGDAVIGGDVYAVGRLVTSSNVEAEGGVYAKGDVSADGDVYAGGNAVILGDVAASGKVDTNELNVANNATINGDLTVKGQVHFASNPNAGLTLSNDANTGDSTITVGVKNAAGETNGVAATSTTTTIRGGTGTTTAVLDDSGFTVTTVEPVTNITTGVTKIDKNGNLVLQGSATTVGINNTGTISNTGDITNTGKVSTTTLAVSGASTTSGITNTGNLTSTGNTTLQSTSGTNSVAVTNAGVNVAATTVNVAATTSAVTKGGTSSLTLNNTGATFAGTASAPVVVSGIANGVNTNDAVNYGQLTSFRNQVQAQIDSSNVELSRGIASTVAMSNIPALDTNKTFSLGVGIGHYNNSNAFAVGANYRINDGIVVRASAGRSGSGSSAIGAGAALAW